MVFNYKRQSIRGSTPHINIFLDRHEKSPENLINLFGLPIPSQEPSSSGSNTRKKYKPENNFFTKEEFAEKLGDDFLLDTLADIINIDAECTVYEFIKLYVA